MRKEVVRKVEAVLEEVEREVEGRWNKELVRKVVGEKGEKKRSVTVEE